MRILIADNQPLYREAVSKQVKRLFADALIEHAPSLAEALLVARGFRPDLFVFDFDTPDMSVMQVSEIRSIFPDIPILVLSGRKDTHDGPALVHAGVRGLLPKSATIAQFSHAVQMLLAGGTIVPTYMLTDQANAGDVSSRLAVLTPREMVVLRATARGLSNKEIARELDLAEVTVKLHLSSVFRKTGARSRMEASILVWEAGVS
ncbi:MAG TPA: response regulator transcription factor [Rhizomicrobium sp.]|jgi:DNA-binding NarL/FixJ family response regulator